MGKFTKKPKCINKLGNTPHYPFPLNYINHINCYVCNAWVSMDFVPGIPDGNALTNQLHLNQTHSSPS